MNRLFDILFSLLLIILTSPLWIILIILIPLSSPGSPFFRHERVGLGGKRFSLLKFRSMRKSKAGDPSITVRGDKRITPLGRVIRLLKLDELPQMLNVLAGRMALIGPRPEAPEYVADYTEKQKEILNYRPGLVDPATLKYRNEEELLAQYPDPVIAYRETVLPDKLKISLEYQRVRSLGSDLKLLLHTIGAIIRFK